MKRFDTTARRETGSIHTAGQNTTFAREESKSLKIVIIMRNSRLNGSRSLEENMVVVGQQESAENL
jgi:hypothetical protein